MGCYPHELSGGMRQRVMIAMALSCEPELLIADEPTTALDVTVQEQILDLLRSLREETGMAILLITHDMGVVAEMADRVLVMYAGQVVEEADTAALFSSPIHPYTRALIDLIPRLDTPAGERLVPIKGCVPTSFASLRGCRFCGRCSYASSVCKEETPALTRQGSRRAVRCWIFADRVDAALGSSEIGYSNATA
jgi:peptide/nickel transport system ATP-binding protein